jgi:hypothetical protein
MPSFKGFGAIGLRGSWPGAVFGLLCGLVPASLYALIVRQVRLIFPVACKDALTIGLIVGSRSLWVIFRF